MQLTLVMLLGQQQSSVMRGEILSGVSTFVSPKGRVLCALCCVNCDSDWKRGPSFHGHVGGNLSVIFGFNNAKLW